MFSPVASCIFACRNVDKTQNGDVGRSTVAIGQAAGLVQEVSKYDGMVANTARSALSVFSDLAKEHKAFEYAGKAVKFAAENVNPLICASGVLKTAMSDDKVETGVTEIAALSAMFAGEGMIKNNYDRIANSASVKNYVKDLSKTKWIKPLVKYLEKAKLTGKASAIVKGLTFVAGSMTSYSIGQALGKDVAGRVKSNMEAFKA